MDFDEYVVVGVEVSEGGHYKFSLLSGGGHKVDLYLREKDFEEGKYPPAFLETIKRVFSVGNVVHCNFLLQRYPEKFNLCLYAFSQQEIVRTDNGEVITAEEYLRPNRGYWVVARSVGEYYRIDPFLFSVGGEAFLPIREGFAPKFLTIQEANATLLDNSRPAFVWYMSFAQRIKFLYRLYFGSRKTVQTQ